MMSTKDGRGPPGKFELIYEGPLMQRTPIHFGRGIII